MGGSGEEEGGGSGEEERGGGTVRDEGAREVGVRVRPRKKEGKNRALPFARVDQRAVGQRRVSDHKGVAHSSEHLCKRRGRGRELASLFGGRERGRESEG